MSVRSQAGRSDPESEQQSTVPSASNLNPTQGAGDLVEMVDKLLSEISTKLTPFANEFYSKLDDISARLDNIEAGIARRAACGNCANCPECNPNIEKKK